MKRGWRNTKNSGWRDIRLIPVVLVATISLFVLKVSGIVLDGGYTLGERLEARNKTALHVTAADTVPESPKIVLADDTPGEKRIPWAQKMFNFNGGAGDVTGSVGSEEGGGEKTTLPVSTKRPPPTQLEISGAAAPVRVGRVESPGERAVLERLQERRRELDKRNRDLDMRETLLKAAEQRMDAKLGELRSMETRDGTPGTRAKAKAEQFKSLVTMYETMKPKDAARIFDRLDLKILVEISTQMNPRKMSEVLAQMTPEAAERLTVELANRASASGQVSLDQLPKIEGKPAIDRFSRRGTVNATVNAGH
jgi:flagellar motility protein MotE (MotC chaperone)